MAADDIVEKKEPKRLPVWACIPLFIVVFLVFMGLYGTLNSRFLVIGAWCGSPPSGDGGVYSARNQYVVGCPYCRGYSCSCFERRSFSDLGLSVKGHASGLWYGFLMAVLLYFLGFGLSLVMGEVEVTGFQFKPLDLLGSLLFFLLVAFFEEILMRGYILGRLRTPA